MILTIKGRIALSKGSYARYFEKSGGKCTYCDAPFGDHRVDDLGRLQVLYMEIDHLIPVAFKGRADNSPGNLFGACQICNRLKGSKLFESVGEVRDMVKTAWRRKGWYHFEADQYVDDEDCSSEAAGSPQMESD